MSATSSEPFGFSEISTAEVDHLESYLVPLAQSVRELVDATIRTTVDEAEIRRATAEIEAITARLRRSQAPGPTGVHFNAEGRSWNWGNAATGGRNAVAPPMHVRHGDDGIVHCDVTLGAAYEGPPGMVHGGILALLLDQIMGETASSRQRPTMTGTLTMRYRQPTPLGPVRIEGRIDRQEGFKTLVQARIANAEGETTVEADGIFILPRWARGHFALRRGAGNETPSGGAGMRPVPEAQT